MENIKDFFKSKLGRVTIRAIVEIVVTTSLMLGIYYGLGKTKEAMSAALGFSAFISLALCFFTWLFDWGAFDFISFGLISLKYRKSDSKPYLDLNDYRASKVGIRELNKYNHFPYLITGVAFFISYVLYINF